MINVERARRSSAPTLQDRVAHAFYDYGRFCSAHPYGCIFLSLLTVLLLSYPALTRFRLPVSSPMDAHWSHQATVHPKDTAPEWLFLSPAVYLQQIVIRGGVRPWNGFNTTAEQAVRGPLSRVFPIREAILNHPSVKSLCLSVRRGAAATGYLPASGCLVLSPAALWHNDRVEFDRDNDVLSTVFAPSCTPAMCIRDILLGMPTSLTGIKPKYQTNRQRSIDYTITVFLSHYDEALIAQLRAQLAEKMELQKSNAADETTFVHVFYRPRKYFTDYFPIAFACLVFMLYMYFSASKLEMVSSRWGLVVAAGFSVAATVLASTGICAHLELTPSLWGAEIFPYVALIVATSNCLCITRSVVYTPPSLDVSSRIAHGLAHEGYSLSKYLFLELAFLGAGYCSGLSEIQEFCFFAVVGMAVDFYMQLLFYTPCLAVDLRRLSPEEKTRFARMLFSTQIPQLKAYPVIGCPLKRMWPRLFVASQRRKKRTLSDSTIDVDKEVTRGHKRVQSTSTTPSTRDDSALSPIEASRSARLRLLYFVTRTRIFQRAVICLFVVWTVWLAFVVHQRRMSVGNATQDSFGVSHRLLETAPQEWGEWQRRTFKWWPVVFNEYNLSLSGHYITFLPPIVLKTSIPPSDPSLLFSSGGEEGVAEERSVPSGRESPGEMRTRIYWLEARLRLSLLVCAVFVFSAVSLFLLYACSWGRWRSGWSGVDTHTCTPSSPAKRLAGKAVDSVPLLFSGHRFPVECAAVCDPRRLASACQDGRVFFWNAVTGERQSVLNRLRGLPPPPPAGSAPVAPPKPPQVWCMHAQPAVVVLGCADGAVEVASVERNKLIGVYSTGKVGIVHVQMRGNKIVLARLDGSMEFVDVQFTTEPPLKVVSFVRGGHTLAHQLPISHLLPGPLCLVSASHDHTIRVWDWRTCDRLNTLIAHDRPVTSLCVDHSTNMVFSSCEAGVVCWWRLESGELVRSSNENTTAISEGGAVSLAVSESFLLGLGADDQLRVWEKSSGKLLTQLARSDRALRAVPLERRHVVGLSNQLAVTAAGATVVFWDLHYKLLIKEVSIGATVDRMVGINCESVLCTAGNTLYRIGAPLIRSDPQHM